MSSSVSADQRSGIRAGEAAPSRRGVPLADPDAVLEGAVTIETFEDGSVQPWRMDHTAASMAHPSLIGPARCGAGVRIRLRTDAISIGLRLEPSDDPEMLRPWLHGLCDLAIGGVRSATAIVAADGEVLFANLPAEVKDVEVWLPVEPAYRLCSLWVDGRARLFPVGAAPRPGWAVYGSSITQGVGVSPTSSWSVLAAHALGRRLHCLGFDGGCHLDPSVAGDVVALGPAYISLEVGINVFLAKSFTARTFGPALHGFLGLIRRELPQTPIALISPVICPSFEDLSEREELTLSQIRATVRSVADIRRSRGDGRLFFVDGRDLLVDAEHFPDGLHPNAEGHRTLAERYVAWEREVLRS
ncbi:GDSL-type esterase/lipase family protein [Nocardia ignorata]|uniref:Lysophospholipase L1-like esterase n=1 Tax=Nocardia ignorata TaxID=145285 RepID=A0A4R6PJ39_NOCIG|nr:lysophospholipase L1-like esterase [Nocardia ignorata]